MKREKHQARAAAAKTKTNSTSKTGLGRRRKIFQAMKLIDDLPRERRVYKSNGNRELKTACLQL
jgi:hypothetical protein